MTAKKTLLIIAGTLRIVSAVLLIILGLMLVVLRGTLTTELAETLASSSINLNDYGVNLSWTDFANTLGGFVLGFAIFGFILAVLCIVSSIFMIRVSTYNYSEFTTRKTQQIALCVLSWFSGLPISSILVTIATNLKINKEKIVNETFEKFNKE